MSARTLPARVTFPVAEIELTDGWIWEYGEPSQWSPQVQHCYAVSIAELRRAAVRQEISRRATVVVRQMLGTDPTPAGIVLALEHAGLLASPPESAVVWSVERDGVPLGTYLSLDEAQAHGEADRVKRDGAAPVGSVAQWMCDAHLVGDHPLELWYFGPGPCDELETPYVAVPVALLAYDVPGGAS